MAGPALVREVVGAALATDGRFLLEDVTITSAGRRRVVRVVVDRTIPDDLSDDTADATSVVAPLTLDEVADATRLVSDSLDQADVMGEQPYTLEVTTPGVGRPLTEPRHFRRNVGRLVRITTAGDGVTGRIVRAGREGLTVAVPATPGVPSSERVVEYVDITKAVVEVEFSRTGTPDAPEAFTGHGPSRPGSTRGGPSGRAREAGGGTTATTGPETEES